MESAMIDPIQFGELRGQVQSLSQQSVELRERQVDMGRKLDEVLRQLQEARGAWKGISWLVGVISAIVGAAVTWFVKHFVER